ncbi:MAG: hydantoinase/oxoprolinase family protein [Rhodospirillales bacterium]|nr:hydantoinase/oxoprolinase family protein [Rhodospirillales bacterium]
MAEKKESVRLAVDIGGTFTDVVAAVGERLTTAKVLTTAQAPERGVLEGIDKVLASASLAPERIELVVHGTTLATNALIERKGAKTALIVTEGFRDSLEMAHENRFEQYDILIDRPAPLVPRRLRWPVRERLDAQGRVLIPLDEDSVAALVPGIKAEGIESVAIGLIHAYVDDRHERRIAEIIAAAYPNLNISLASAVCPEIREYERQSTTCANAYVQPLMARYLKALDVKLRTIGIKAPFLLMTSSGGLATLETAMRFPVRLVESGPAGGAILAGQIAAECGLARVLSFDMGGTTAKVCLIDGAEPLTTRAFEVGRVYRFLKGSGLPLRIPAIEMVEIGAGGGSIADVDTLRRVAVGPESAGAEPGPACYDRGGELATVTDADLVLGRLDTARFAGGAVKLAPERAGAALAGTIGASLNLSEPLAAFAVSEVVDENMANAARVHAIEWGRSAAGRALVAYGGAAPLHAPRLADKLGIDTIVVPTGAGVGAAIGFLRAPVSYEVVRSRHLRLSEFAAAPVNALHREMHAEALHVVRQAAPRGALDESRSAYMRYIGQGHEIEVALPVRKLRVDDVATLRRAFDETYETLFGRTIPGLDVEALSWTLTIRSIVPERAPVGRARARRKNPEARSVRPLFEASRADYADAPVFWREDLKPGARIRGPALIAEDQTTTVVPASFNAQINALGYIVLTRKMATQGGR